MKLPKTPTPGAGAPGGGKIYSVDASNSNPPLFRMQGPLIDSCNLKGTVIERVRWVVTGAK